MNIVGMVMGICGLFIASAFTILGWLSGWVLFGVGVVAIIFAMDRSWSLFATSIGGMLSLGVFTTIAWLDVWIFFSVMIVASLILALKITAKMFSANGGGAAGD